MFRSSPPHIVKLAGASNFRDLGGYKTADGRRVRRGKIFRSASLAGLTPADLSKVQALGIRTVVDFRTEKENERQPDPEFGATRHNFPISTEVGASLRDILLTREATGADLHSLLTRAYETYALGATEQYRAFIALVVDSGNHALLFHCAAGKDRTGFGAAMLLTALGVPYATVREDYLATNKHWRGDSSLAPMLGQAARDVLLRAHGDMLDHAFDLIRKHDGSFDAFLARTVGLDAIARTALRDMLLE